MTKYNITLFDSIRQRNPRMVEMDLEMVARGLTNPVHRSIDERGYVYIGFDSNRIFFLELLKNYERTTLGFVVSLF